MRVTAFAVLALASTLAAVPSPGFARTSTQLYCPTEARGTVVHNGDAQWYATPQSSRVISLTMGNIAGQVALICNYELFGATYIIWQPAPAGYPNCRADGPSSSFICTV
jgi:hypothetical protein